LRIIQAEEGMKMIEDYIMDTLDDWKTLSVSSVVRSAVVDLGCTVDEAEDAIINLENQGRVKGRIDKEEQTVLIELACPCDTCRFKRDNYNPPNQCPNFNYFFDAFMSACGADIPTLKTDLCDKREAKE